MTGSAPAERVIAAALARGLRIAVAESLTGGLLADALVSVPGASRVFSGGIVAYDTALKHSLLGVDAQLLRDHGPVHEQVARQMARGVREACAVADLATLGVATTGVAGPDPDPQTGQEPGTVWIALSVGEREVVEQFALGLESRADIRHRTVEEALRLLCGEIERS